MIQVQPFEVLELPRFSNPQNEFCESLNLLPTLVGPLDRMQTVSLIHAKLKEMWVHQHTNKQRNTILYY